MGENMQCESRRGECDGWGNSNSRTPARGGKPGTDSRWQLSSSTWWSSSSWSATKYFWIRSQFSFEICWVLFRMLVRSAFYLSIYSASFWQFAKIEMSLLIRHHGVLCLVELLPVAVRSVWERLSFLHPAPAWWLTVQCASNRRMMKSRIRFQNPLPREQGWLGLKKYLASHETDLVAVAS